MAHAYLKEIFYSIQGEGPYAGVSHYFIRLCNCNLNCAYCDTDKTPTDFCVVELIPGNPSILKIKNPVEPAIAFNALKQIITPKPNKMVSLTGGEPLLQVEFLKEMLYLLRGEGYKVYLETNGTLPAELKELISKVDIISMDIKLHLFNDQKYIDLQQKFLEIALEKEVFIKIVIDREMSQYLLPAVKMISKMAQQLPVFLQPEAQSDLTVPELLRLQEEVVDLLPHVRIIPQLHKILDQK